MNPAAFAQYVERLISGSVLMSMPKSCDAVHEHTESCLYNYEVLVRHGISEWYVCISSSTHTGYFRTNCGLTLKAGSYRIYYVDADWYDIVRNEKSAKDIVAQLMKSISDPWSKVFLDSGLAREFNHARKYAMLMLGECKTKEEFLELYGCIILASFKVKRWQDIYYEKLDFAGLKFGISFAELHATRDRIRKNLVAFARLA